MANVEEAKKVVQRLTKKYGYLNQDMMEQIGNWRPEFRREIDENWLAIESTAAHSVKTLAKQIYGSGARFVFELLQNADDNSFKKATEAGSDPFISFKVHPSRIIVECNEDGFSERDLDAISAVGQSTKSSSGGYIGAKGIGFKSVFIAAWRVYIQSGKFSFEFKHRKSDPGLGMVRPIWVNSDEQLAGPLTRMTLTLHDEGDEDELEHLRCIIHQQFAELQQTCLLFLQQIRRISIEFYDTHGTLERSKTFWKEIVDDYRVSVKNRRFENCEETTESQVYHITSRQATGLTRSDNRDAPGNDTLRDLLSSAKIVLAFPLTSDFEPITTGKQELFAFLPVEDSDYKFLIHTDFDTSASRQDIVTTSRRNRDLRGEIAETLIKAILEFCKHPTLCYTWPLFLPKTDETFGMFWSNMNSQISSLLKEAPCIKSRNRTSLRLIREVLTMFEDFKDENGDPSFDDEKDRFISSLYTPEATQILKGYGLNPIHSEMVLDMVEADLRNPDSRMKGYAVSNQWHSRVANMLRIIHEDGKLAGRVEHLGMIPLQDGNWTSANAQQVYYPTTKGTHIPADLKISILSALAMKSAMRKQLFEAVGVKQASVELVRRCIFDECGRKNSKRMTIWRDYLHYLYLTHTDETRGMYENAQIGDSNFFLRKPQERDIYLPNRPGPFSPESLLASTDAAPGMNFTSAHKVYMNDPPVRPNPDHPTWERWLYDLVGVREHLRLVSRDGTKLSKAAKYVFSHRKDKFLDVFQHLWSVEHPRLDFMLIIEIIKLPAKELCGVDFSVRLSETWLPERQLRDLVAKYMTKPESFPFLKIENSEEDLDLGLKWRFLHDKFLVGRDNNVSFLLEILYYIEEGGVDESSISQIQKVYDLYTAIYARLISNDSEASKVEVHFHFGGIIVPVGGTVSWVGKDECRWVAPPDMKTTISLKSIYARTLGTEQLENIGRLLKDTATVGNASLPDIVDELKYMRSNGCREWNHVGKLYDHLISLDRPIAELRTAFEDDPLIYAEEDGDARWFRASECLWSSPTKIRGKAVLEEHYENLEDFFVETLGVKSLTLQMIYDDLRREGRTDIDKLRVDLLTLSSFLQEEPEAAKKLKPETLLKANIFPVRYANASPELRTAQVDFAIGDRQYLTDHFRDQLCLLDFELKDIRPLEALIRWAGLEDRYLTRLVHEETFVSDGTERRIRSVDRDVGRKAYYILRLAATFNSPRYSADRHGLYDKLRASEVITVRKITSVAKVIQNRQPYARNETDGTFHMKDTEEGLKLYVPRNRKKQEICFITTLPKGLAEWLMQDSNNPENLEHLHEAEAILSLILSCGRSVLDDILDRRGIIPIDVENEDPIDEPEDSEEEDDASVSDAVSGTRSSSVLQLTPAASTIADNPLDVVEEVLTRRTNNVFLHSQGGLFRLVDDQYINLLDRVIRMARTSRFPSQGAFNMSGMQEALSNVAYADAYVNYDGRDITFRFRSTGQLDRDKKVGAAGELYVFELLSGLALPTWSRGNWQSTIRTLVNVHRDYADIGAWGAIETADIVYSDTTGTLTRLLIEEEYLDHDAWDGATPEYLVEVKTTTGPCNVPFFMSDKQHRLMRSVHANRTEDRSTVYLICRVFNVNSDNIGMRIYLDPEQLRQDGQLLFTAQGWSVIPGDGVRREQ